MDKLELNLFSIEENGEAELEEAMEVSLSSSPFGAFSIRNYVAAVCKVDIKKCWPFSPRLLETKLQKGVDNVLPPLEIPTFRYWRCAKCVESAVTPDDSNQERNVHMQLDALESDVLIQNVGNLLTKQVEKEEYISDNIVTSVLEAKPQTILEKDEADEKKATSHVSEDIGSEEAPLVCSENAFHSRDGGAEETKTEQLAGNEILINLTADALHQSYSESKTTFCNSTSSPKDSELTPPACWSVCANSRALADEVTNERTAEEYMQGLNVTEMAEVFGPASVTTDSVEKYRTVNRSDHEDEGDLTTETERHHFVNDNIDKTPCTLIAGCSIDIDDSPCTSIAGRNINMDDCPTQLSAYTGNEETVPKVKKTESKQLKENGKTQKKRSIADLIATAPSQQIKGDCENQSWASENSPRKARFGTWNKKSVRSQKSFKNGMHGWKEFNCKKEVISEVPSSMLKSFVLEKSHPKSLEMMTKCQQLGIEVQSSSSQDIKQETRSPDEGGLLTNSLQRLEIDDLAMGLKKRKLVHKSISDEMQKTKTSVESDDDLMDLAGFLAQKQLERISSFPSSGLPKRKRFRRLQKNRTRHKLNHVLRHKKEQLSEQVQLLPPNLSFTEGLVRRQDVLINSPDQVASEKGHPYLVVEQGQEQLVRVNNSLVPVELNVSRQVQKESIIIAKRDGTVSVSKDNSKHTGNACEKKLRQEGKFDASVMMVQKSCKGYSTSQRKNSVACDLKKPSASPKHGNGSIPSQAIPENNHLYISAERRHQQINQFLDSDMQEKSIMSKQTKGMRTGQRSKRTSFVTRKGGNDKKFSDSKRLKSTTQKSLKKLKLYSNHDLTGEQKTCTYITTAEAPSDDPMHLESEGACQQSDQVENSLMSQGLIVSGQATEISNNSTRNEAFSDSNDSFDDRRWLTAKNSGHRRKNVKFLAMMGTEKKGSSASKCKPIAASTSCYGISSGSEYLSGTIQTIDKESIVLRSQPASSTAIKQGKESSTSKMKNSGTNKPIDGRNLPPNQDVRTQVALNHNLAGVASEDAQTDPIAGEGQEMNPNEVCLTQENTDMAGGDGVILQSRDCLDIPIKMGENKSGQKCKAMSKPKDEGSSRSQRKKSFGKISMKERKALAKSEGRHMSIIEETNAALNAAFSNGNARKPQFAGTVIRGNGHCSERTLNSGTCKLIPPEAAKAVNSKDFTPQQTLIQPTVAPTSKGRELLIINDDSVQLSLSSEGIFADSSKMSCKTFESEKVKKKDDILNTRSLGLKSVSIRESEKEPWHSSVDSPVQSIGRKSLIRNADARLVAKNQDALEHDNSLVQCHGNAFSNGFEKQSSSNATCLPAKGSSISQHVPNNSGSCNSLGSLLPHVTLATPSTESAPEFNQCSPSNYSTVFGFAQGNRVNMSTKSSQETSWRGNYNPNMYIQDGITTHTTNWGPGYDGCKQNASVTMDTAARKHSERHQTIAKNLLGSSSARTITGFEALDSDPLKQNLVEPMTSNGKVETNQRIEKISYINVLTNTRQVPQAKQNLQPKTGSVAKIKDSASKQTMQSEYVEPESLVDLKNLTLGLAPSVLKHQNFRRKSPIASSNMTNLIETGTWEADTSKQRITSMHDDAKAVLTSQSHTSLMPTPLKRLKFTPGHKNCLNMPVQKTKQHIPIHSTFPSMREPIGGKYFQDELKTYPDQYGRLIRTSDKPFQMETRTHYSISNASEAAFVSSTQENVRTNVSKGLYGRADINSFLRPVIGGDEVSGGASDKEGSVLTSVCKDSSLELTLSIQQR
ncbi:uncharacterized protein LOC131057426 isoform X2 [Cryptomeria japonica]|uniref:uncharacterized protein LOC131057426 isoform X2 n=1 Tax=Cryptomeria japonica TaxID=3369 RepID=UPI0027DA98B0|nr:uncharacterized protein LOC131057426 isoform X2 [Cryptomeria japonica]